MEEKIKLVSYTDDDYEFVYNVKKSAYKKYVEECWGLLGRRRLTKIF